MVDKAVLFPRPLTALVSFLVFVVCFDFFFEDTILTVVDFICIFLVANGIEQFFF